MGASATTLASTLTPSQAAEFTRLLRIEYEECISKNMPEEELRIRMESAYRTAYETVTAPTSSLDLMLSNAKKLNRGTSKVVTTLASVTNENNKKTTTTTTRRRSYGEKDNVDSNRRKSFDTRNTKVVKKSTSVELPTGAASTSMTPSESTSTLMEKVEEEEKPANEKAGGDKPVEDKREREGDSWDSVTSQPSCMICSMVFNTVQKLNNHTKYSEVHIQNVKKLAEQAARAELSNKTTEETIVTDDKGITYEIECPRCKPLYTGSKLFWRTQTTCDIHIYLHIIPQCVEVIPYETSRNIEFPRLYFNAKLLIDIIGEKNIKEKTEDKKKELNLMRKSVVVNYDIIYEEQKRLAISSFLLAHLKCQDSPNVLGGHELVYDSMGQSDINPILPPIPNGVTPVHVPRRRHSSEAEIESKIRDINNLTAEAKLLSSKAERISNIFTKGMESLKNNIGSSDRMIIYSVPRRRWIQAIKRVLRQNLVRKNTTNMRERFGNKYFVNIKNYN